MAGTSIIAICNMALARIGQGKQIVSLTENSTAAATCATFYEQCRNEVLSEFDWPFALRRVELALVEQNPNDDWSYSYRKPSDCLTIRKVLAGFNRMQDPLAFKVGGDSSGALIYSDYDTAVVEYIALVDNPALYSPKFVSALAWRLAMDLAPVLQQSMSSIDVLERRYQMALESAKVHDANEGVPDPESDGAFIEARTGGISGAGSDWTAYPGAIRIS